MKTNLRFLFFVLLSLCYLSGPNPLLPQTSVTDSSQAALAEFEVDVSTAVLSGVPFELTVVAKDSAGNKLNSFEGTAEMTGVSIGEISQGQASSTIAFLAGSCKISKATIDDSGSHKITITSGKVSSESALRVIPGPLSLFPPLFAIILAFLARQVLISLFFGIWLGALFLNDYNILTGFMRTIDTYIVKAISDPSQASVLIFSLTLGGMVGVMSRSGGTQGIVDKLSKLADSRRGGQIATWAMGLLIFFDDYANSLVVGNTMRPFTDRLRISREKLSYIVDSTAAPVASVALISTWVGFQVGLIDQSFETLGLTENAYNAFLQSIPHATYSILALVFVFMVSISLKDFGPMLKAEKRALHENKVLRDGAQPLTDSAALDMAASEETPRRWYNAIIPISVVIAITFIGLYVDGKTSLGAEAATKPLGEIFGAANSFNILMWASFAGMFTAVLLAVSQRVLTLNEAIESAVSGYKSMMMAGMILVLAWSIGSICKELHTADFVITASKGILSPHLIPVLTFVIAAFISFSTGSSWATMAILTPIVVPIAYKLPMDAGLASSLNHEILIGTIGAILSGSVLGDHCSPISDTTILSSMASAADHVDHVRTQLPYATLVGTVACVVGYVPNGWGLNSFISLILGIGILLVIWRFLGEKLPNKST